MDNRFRYTAEYFRARCVAVESPEYVILYIDVGFRNHIITPMRLHGIKDPKGGAKEFLESNLFVGDDTKVWPIKAVTYRDPEDNDKYIARLYIKNYSTDILNDICVNERMVNLGLAKPRTY